MNSVRVAASILNELQDYHVARGGIPSGWVYLGDDYKRYVLGQPGERNILVFGINPSSAKPGDDDPTIRNVRRIVKNVKKADGWIMMNLYPQRTSNPDALIEDEFLRENNLKVVQAVCQGFPIESIWCAWGNMIERFNTVFLYESLRQIYGIIDESVPWEHYGNLTKNGHPRHPLYMRLIESFQPFHVREYIHKALNRPGK